MLLEPYACTCFQLLQNHLQVEHVYMRQYDQWQMAPILLLAIPLAFCSGAAAQAGRPRTRVVRSGSELIEAIKDGVMHIVVGAHIDLTDTPGELNLPSKGYDFDRPLVYLNGTQSIRVRSLQIT